MEPLTVYMITQFQGFYPVGTAAVVVAKDEAEAIASLDAALKRKGLPGIDSEDVFVAVDVTKPSVHVLLDGDY